VLLYHGVPSTVAEAGRLAISASTFAEHLDVIVDSGRVAVTVGDIAAGLRGERPLPERAVAITFDDGYDDTEAAVEALRERGLCASIYVTTGDVGAPGMIRREQVERLALAGDAIELGAHSVGHPFLDELSVTDITREVRTSKQQLEHLISRPVETFAYPYGAYDRRVRAAVVAAGYSSAAAVKNALSHPDDDPWAVARWTVQSSTGAAEIEQVLSGRGVPRAWRGERLRTRAYRLARRMRRGIREAASVPGSTTTGRNSAVTARESSGSVVP
jgi:peptidoglycan/xylan/chitin deacetylase (PgdA/CDA1 family)